MKVIRSIPSMQHIARALQCSGKRIGFVPTMGALHGGHLSLIRRAKRDNDIVVVSIFVNPTQFGPTEDFQKYPRPFMQDKKICTKEGVAYLFYPQVIQMYPQGFRTYTEVKGISDVYCGKLRPGHFRGVATVVMKLFHIVLPNRAYFGQKDAQQSIIIRRIVKDMNMQVEVVVIPTIRERDGLAMSSRNAYLSDRERGEALVLSQALVACRGMVRSGERRARRLIARVTAMVREHRCVKLEYCAVVDVSTMQPLQRLAGRVLILLAARVGNVRLIDNCIIPVSWL